MSFFDLFRKKKPEGLELSPFETELSGHGLLEWYREFTPEERAQIETHARRRSRAGASEPVAFLREIAPRGKLGRRVLARAEVVAQAANDPVALGRLQDGRIDRCLRDMDADATARDEAVTLCEKQIAAAGELKAALAAKGGALPRHHGYEQLAILNEKLKRYDEAIRLSQQARDQGWAGDWDTRIARCEGKRHHAREPDPAEGDDVPDAD